MVTDSDIEENAQLYTLPDKKWHWKARTSALHFYQTIPKGHSFKVLFASSTLNLCELLALRPDLVHLEKILYFHENQLSYPQQHKKDRDFQYGYNQILSCLVACRIVFNSHYNMTSFIDNIPKHLKQQPAPRCDWSVIVETIKQKSQVLHFPLSFSFCEVSKRKKDGLSPLHIIWPHRWEHDKGPETFFNVLFELSNGNHEFVLSVLGESYSEVPSIFKIAKERLSKHIIHWGYAETKERYEKILQSGDVVVSTSNHEFYGVAMLEAVNAGCYPICPNKLVYPEIYPKECLYNTENQLRKKLADWCEKPQFIRRKMVNFDIKQYTWDSLKNSYRMLLQINT